MTDILDDVDQKIMAHLCEGMNSYSKLADKVGVSRNTVYRRVKNLKEKGAIRDKDVTIPDIEKIGYSFALIGMDVSPEDLDEAIDYLKTQDNIKFLWKTFGFYEIIVLIISKQNQLGDSVNEMRGKLESRNIEVRRYGVSPGISWEKLDFSLKSI
ncbi:MAG: Lrp/AsnC family transcriptional regulator [Thermoplasmatota archaeon]